MSEMDSSTTVYRRASASCIQVHAEGGLSLINTTHAGMINVNVKAFGSRRRITEFQSTDGQTTPIPNRRCELPSTSCAKASDVRAYVRSLRFPSRRSSNRSREKQCYIEESNKGAPGKVL
jgi:hypothetical protein